MFKLLKRLNRREWGMIALSLVLIVAQVWMDLKVPDYMATITEKLQQTHTTTAEIMQPGYWMVGLSLLSVLSSIIVGYLVAKIAAGLSARIRQDVYDRVLDDAEADIRHFSVASLLTRTTNDITQVQTFVAMGLQAIIKAPITAIWAITKIANKGWQWTTATGVAVLILIIMLALILTLVQPKFKAVQRLTDRLNLITRENLDGIRVVHAYNAEAYQNRKFDQANQDLTQTNLFANRVLALMSPGMSLISNGLTLAVYMIGAILINQATNLTVRVTLFGNMVVFSSYAMQVIMAFLLLSIIFVLLPRVSVSAKRINAVLATQPSLSSPATAPTTTTQPGTLEFQDVSFTYPAAKRPALEHLTFTAQPGQTVALIGATGSGKTTALSLISRQADATSGRVLVNGIDVRDYPTAALNDQLGVVPQTATLFSGTVGSNLRLGSAAAASDQQLQQALQTAQASDFIAAQSAGLETPVAQHGDNFSGGQKQRLGIARALVRQPHLLLFDDSFSALDYQTDQTLRTALKTDLPNATKVIVAQRISTIMDADQIIVLDGGQVVGQGTHADLLATNQVYQEIAYSQLSKEELANDEN